MFNTINWTFELIYILRLFIAGICGLAIGIERKNRAKEAGLRTHFVVACGAALMMLISKYGFIDMEQFGAMKVVDGARIAAQVVSGVGFLGAGMIFVQKQTITGLTTAAGIWTTAGIGMAIGAGMYVVGISATVLILLAQFILHKNLRGIKLPKNKIIYISGVTTPHFQEETVKLLKDMGLHVHDTYVSRYADTNTTDYKFIVDIPACVIEDELLLKFEFNCSIRDMTE